MNRLTKEGIGKILEKCNAVKDGHFVYAPKADGYYHGSKYVDKDSVYPHTDATVNLCREISDHYKDLDPDCVVGPEKGGAKVAQWTANSLSAGRPVEVLAISADEEDIIETKEKFVDASLNGEFSANGKVKLEPVPNAGGNYGTRMKLTFEKKIGTRRVIKRGQDKLVEGKRCLIVEDIINSGKTVADTIAAVRKAGGIDIGVACFCNRSGGKVTAESLGVPALYSLMDVDMQMFREEECPLCEEGVPVCTEVGKGEDFLKRKGRTA